VRGRVLLVGSVLAAILVAVLTTVVLVLVEPELSKAEAIKTGALGGGAIVALYALWLNDRRRRTDEARHELESDKAADERFARSVELLGNEADQVRVGALHALAWLADSTARYKQTVLDVFCAYLRRPFTHPSYTRRADDPDQVTVEDSLQADQERQVRLTAQRLITDLLPWGQNFDSTAYHLDLTGASLEYFRLEGRRIGRLTARRTRFYGITRMSELHASKPALFTSAKFLGRVDLREAQFEGGLSFQDTTFDAEVAFQGTSVSTFIDLNTTAPERQTGTLTITEETKIKGDTSCWALVDLPTRSLKSGDH
jgi:Pentapeptide repeats (9 copies)